MLTFYPNNAVKMGEGGYGWNLVGKICFLYIKDYTFFNSVWHYISNFSLRGIRVKTTSRKRFSSNDPSGVRVWLFTPHNIFDRQSTTACNANTTAETEIQDILCLWIFQKWFIWYWTREGWLDHCFREYLCKCSL